MDPTPVPKPSTGSGIKDGAVAGIIPSAEAFAVNYPGYPSSVSRAVDTLGGLPEIAKARGLDSNCLELRFRPEDPHCHPAFGELRPFSGFLLKISKTRPKSGEEGKEKLTADVVARVNQGYHFEGMVDYQHVVAVHAARARGKKRHWSSDWETDLENDDSVNNQEEVMMLAPPLFSLKDRPEKIMLNPSANLFSRNLQKRVVEHSWEMDIEPCHAIPFNIEKIPVKFNWEDNIPRDTAEWELQQVVSKLFEERPIWPRWSLHEKLLDGGLEVTETQLKRLLFRAGYYFSTGPFGRFWIRKGYDPRKDPESRIFQRVDFRVPAPIRSFVDANTKPESKQTWKDICQFHVLPSKSFSSLQLFELLDDFIQQEIRKPTDQKTCTHATGWFPVPLLKMLRSRVSIRFLSMFPKGGAERLLRSTCEEFERVKKSEALRRFWNPEKKNLHVTQDSEISVEVPLAGPNGAEHELEGQDVCDNCQIENEEDEEQVEEELDGYESPPVAGEDHNFSLEPSAYQIGESIQNDYLQELLRTFPFDKDDKASKSRESPGADLSDGEYQIYEQNSDDNFDDDDDDFS